MNEIVISAGEQARPSARVRELPSWAVIVLAGASTGLFALVVNLVRLGFAHTWSDPVGYVVALLEPLALTLPGYLVVRVVLGWGKLEDEIESVAGALKNASITIACYAPVIWFYLVTSPTPNPTFPVIAFSFGALAFWLPLSIDLARRARRAATRHREALFTYAWLAIMFLAEARMLLGWLGRGIAGRFV
jgi:hypothetical protein